MNILETILAHKKEEVAAQKLACPLRAIQDEPLMHRPTCSLRQALLNSPTGIIAEFKRKSPSKGWIHPDAQATLLTAGYQAAGAAALSILTDARFFGGSLDDLRQARASVTLPLLRKEFIVEEYQIYQSRVLGADAILLIASALTLEQCHRFTALAQSLGLEVLLELHGAEELPYAACPADVIGINNRNLTTFETNPHHSVEMIEKLPSGRLYISESGLSEPQTVQQLRQAGFRGFLMGESFMREAHPDQALAQFITQLTPSES